MKVSKVYKQICRELEYELYEGTSVIIIPATGDGIAETVAIHVDMDGQIHMVNDLGFLGKAKYHGKGVFVSENGAIRCVGRMRKK